MSKERKTFDLEQRLIDFAVRIIRTAESLPKTREDMAVDDSSSQSYKAGI